MKDLAENVFFICDQLRLKQWQEDRLYHALLLEKFVEKISFQLNDLIKALLSDEKTIEIGESLFALENNCEISIVLDKIRDFLDEIKTNKIGWGGGVQNCIDSIHKEIEIFAHNYNKK